MAEGEPAASTKDKDEDEPAPRPLEYPSPSLSSFDRPVEPVVRFAQGVRLAMRITYVVAAVAIIVFVVWAVLWISATFEAVGR